MTGTVAGRTGTAMEPHEETWTVGEEKRGTLDMVTAPGNPPPQRLVALFFGRETFSGIVNENRARLAAHAPELARMLLAELERERGRAARSEPPGIDEDAAEDLLRRAGVLK